MLQRLVAIGSASIINVASVALLSLLLAKILTIEEFGIVRTTTAYAIALTMLGNFTLHDSLAFHIANSKKEELQNLFFHAAIMTMFFSSIVAIGATIIFYNINLWKGDLKTSLLLISALLPIMCLTITYNNSLQALGSHRTFAIVTIISGLTPLLIILPLSYAWSLNGWLLGRSVAIGLLLISAFYFVREYISICEFKFCYISKLWSFSRVQILSAMLSLVLMSMDVIYLEHITHDLSIIAHYGLAQLFAKTPLFLASTLSRAYFKDIASSNDNYKMKTREFFYTMTMAAISVAFALYHICPLIITRLYGPEYQPANSLIRIMSFGIIFNFLWNAISTVTLAQGKPNIAVKVSLAGAGMGVLLLYVLTPEYGAIGAAWAMSIAYASGVLVGLYFIVSSYRRV